MGCVFDHEMNGDLTDFSVAAVNAMRALRNTPGTAGSMVILGFKSLLAAGASCAGGNPAMFLATILEECLQWMGQVS